MGALSSAWQVIIGNAMLRATNVTAPSQTYLALFTGDPTAAGTGPETTYTGYARVTTGSPASSAWNAPDGTGTTKNNNTIVFPAVGGASSVTITHWALFDALTTGNMLLYGPLTASKTLNVTDVPSFPANALQITYS